MTNNDEIKQAWEIYPLMLGATIPPTRGERRAKPHVAQNPRGPRKTKAEKKRDRKLAKAARKKQRGRK